MGGSILRSLLLRTLGLAIGDVVGVLAGAVDIFDCLSATAEASGTIEVASSFIPVSGAPDLLGAVSDVPAFQAENVYTETGPADINAVQELLSIGSEQFSVSCLENGLQVATRLLPRLIIPRNEFIRSINLIKVEIPRIASPNILSGVNNDMPDDRLPTLPILCPYCSELVRDQPAIAGINTIYHWCRKIDPSTNSYGKQKAVQIELIVEINASGSLSVQSKGRVKGVDYIWLK